MRKITKRLVLDKVLSSLPREERKDVGKHSATSLRGALKDWNVWYRYSLWAQKGRKSLTRVCHISSWVPEHIPPVSPEPPTNEPMPTEPKPPKHGRSTHTRPPRYRKHHDPCSLLNHFAGCKNVPTTSDHLCTWVIAGGASGECHGGGSTVKAYHNSRGRS